MRLRRFRRCLHLLAATLPRSLPYLLSSTSARQSGNRRCGGNQVTWNRPDLGGLPIPSQRAHQTKETTMCYGCRVGPNDPTCTCRTDGHGGDCNCANGGHCNSCNHDSTGGADDPGPTPDPAPDPGGNS